MNCGGMTQEQFRQSVKGPYAVIRYRGVNGRLESVATNATQERVVADLAEKVSGGLKLISVRFGLSVRQSVAANMARKKRVAKKGAQ